MVALSPELLEDLTDPQIDAMVEIMLLAASADGSLDYAEVAQLKKSLLQINDLWLSHVDLDAKIQAAHQRIEGQDRASRLVSLRKTLETPAHRIAALELAVKVMASDGIIRTSERELLLDAATTLGIEGEIAADIVTRVS